MAVYPYVIFSWFGLCIIILIFECLFISKRVSKETRLKSPFLDSTKPDNDGTLSDPEASIAASVKDVVEAVLKGDVFNAGGTTAGVGEGEMTESGPAYAQYLLLVL